MEEMNVNSVIESGDAVADSKQIVNFGVKRTKIYFDEDNYISLNLSDTNVVKRYYNSRDKVESIINEFDKKAEQGTEDNIIDDIYYLDQELRNVIDYIFDEKICEKVIGNASVFTITDDGNYFFTKVFETLMPLYEKDFKLKSKKLEKKFSKHLDKYK